MRTVTQIWMRLSKFCLWQSWLTFIFIFTGCSIILNYTLWFIWDSLPVYYDFLIVFKKYCELVRQTVTKKIIITILEIWAKYFANLLTSIRFSRLVWNFMNTYCYFCNLMLVTTISIWFVLLVYDMIYLIKINYEINASVVD